MSIKKKHRLEDAGDPEDTLVLPTKKLKTADSSDVKKDKKRKRDKEGKKERKEKKKEKKHRNQDNVADIGQDHGDDTQDSKIPKIQERDAFDSPAKSVLYKQTDSLTALSESEIEEFFAQQQVAIFDSTTSSRRRPILDFVHLPTSALLSKSPFASFSIPTPIQSATWPYSLSGRDVIGIAETGSGKTLAFALPCLEILHSSPPPRRSDTEYNKKRSSSNVAKAMAVIVSPTRELAMQTYESISTLAALVGISSVCLYGGASKDDQRALLQRKQGADIIVATPGRLKDFLSDGTVMLDSVRFAVLDEADRMLDKGFEDDIKSILGQCPERGKRQTLMFTATWPTSVQGLAEGFMVDPVKITIGGRTKAGDVDSDGNGNGTVELQANSRISQTIEVVDPQQKEWRLLQLLKEAQQGKGRRDRVLVFCLYKKEAVRMENFLQRKGIHVASIHGDLKQDQRTRSLEAFKAGTTTVLVATDVAARGLDIPEVKLVINVTFPLTIEDYVHRIGRTGRAGKVGQAITLFTEHDKAHSGSLINVLKGANQPVPDELLKFGSTVKKKGHGTYGAFFKDVDMNKKGTKITFD